MVASLSALVPGAAALLRCPAGDAQCGVSPLVRVSVGMLVLSQVGKMSHMCLLSGLTWAAALLTLDAAGLVVPSLALKACGALVVAAHVPVLNKRQSLSLLALCGVLGLGAATGRQEDAKVVLLLLSGALLVHRALLVALTLRASTPANAVFPIVSHVMPRWSFGSHDFFRTDDPPEAVAKRREAAFEALNAKWSVKFAKGLELSSYLADKFSDLRFTAGNRVFIPYQRMLEGWCDPCTVVARSDRTDLVDIDGHRLTDVSGSYGVNVCGYEAYKRFMREGMELTKDVGCVLGPLHPLVRDNIDMLRSISNKQEVSFHMSGTEAVMSAVRLARFNTGKKYIVLFGGAYHGWWDGVQSLAGNERAPGDVLTLKDMAAASMDVIRWRAHEIAAVVINPLQAFHPNAPPPSDLVLASNTRDVSDSTKEYKKWLETMREVCSALGVVLIFDEVYTGFRLAPGGAQEYFGVNADMVVYGKTLGGGFANGICCGPRHLMARSDPAKPLRAAYVIGTFSAHPTLVGAMHQFLKWVSTKEAREQYVRLRTDVQAWVKDVNARLDKEFPNTGAPLAIQSYSSVWTMLYKRPGRYHWMLQYYLKDEGLNLSWVGTGRLSLSLDFTRKDLDQVADKIIRACHRMEDDGWWWNDKGQQPSKAGIQLHLVAEILKALAKRVLGL